MTHWPHHFHLSHEALRLMIEAGAVGAALWLGFTVLYIIGLLEAIRAAMGV